MKYKTCYCGADCYKNLDGKDEPKECFGSVHAIDEIPCGDDDYYWVHACEKHSEEYDG